MYNESKGEKKVKSFTNINYGKTNHPDQVLDIYLPETETFPVFVYFHGGGLEEGDKDMPVLTEYLIKRGIALVSCNYRIYPEAVFPDFVKDAACAVDWVKRNIQSYGNATKVFVGGSSAGGYISLLLCFDKKYLAPYKINPDEIDGFIHDAGQPTSHFNVLRERGLDSRMILVDETAPLYHIRENKNYPPMLILFSDNDMENRYEQSQLMLSTLKHFNGELPQIEYKIMHGTHCQYVIDDSNPDEYVFGKLVADYIEKQINARGER